MFIHHIEGVYTSEEGLAPIGTEVTGGCENHGGAACAFQG